MRKILVLCKQNSCRSQMSEGYLDFFAGEQIQAFSAGLASDNVHPLAVKAMAEDNIDISQKESKSFSVYNNHKFDFLITVCREVKKNIPKSIRAKRHFHFEVADPALATGTEEEQLIVFRKVREDIKKNILKFIGQELLLNKPVEEGDILINFI
ncbi:MAG TPA: arsenate reductase ArsC [Flavilitoribacter sp.]|nr:arsenate reductase ArsC [Flavilitoribacter sp.]